MATTIAQLDIDVDEVTKKAGETRKKLMEIAEEMKALKKNFAEGNISVEEYTQQLSQLTAVQKETQKDLRTYESIMQANVAANGAAMQSNTLLTGSIRELSAALSQNKKAYSEMSAEQRESAEGKALLATIQEQDKAYKELQKSIGNTQVEVGNYKQAILDALGDNNSFGVSLNGIIANLESMKSKMSGLATIIMNYINYNKASATAMNATAAATAKSSLAMKIFRGVLVSTGLGAIIVLLGSLVAYLTSTQEGIDKVARVITPLKVVFQTLWGVVQNVGKALVEAFTHPKKILDDLLKFIEGQVMNRINGVVNVFKGLGSILTGDIKEGLKQVGEGTLQTVTGVKDLTGEVKKSIESMKQMGKEMKDTINEALERGARIEEINQKLSASEADFIEQTAALKEQFKAQNKIAEDTTKTCKEREEAARKSIEIQRSINALARERNGLEQELLNLKFASNDTSDADRAELARKKAEYDT